MTSQRLLTRADLPRPDRVTALMATLPGHAAPPSELRAVLGFLRRNWRFIAGCGAAALALGLLAFLLLPARYGATTSLVVENRRPRPVVEATSPTEDLGYVETQILTIQSDLILGAVVRDLRLTEDPYYDQGRSSMLGGLRSLLSGGSGTADAGPEEMARLREQAAVERLRTTSRVRRLGNSFVVDIGVTSDEAEKSARVANAVAAHFVEDQRRLSTLITDRTNPASTTRIISPAARPLKPTGPGGAVVLLVSALLGLAGGSAFAAVRETLDRRLRSAGDVERRTGLPCLGVIPAVQPSASERPAPGSADALFPAGSPWRHAAEQPRSDATERMRLMRSTIEEWRRDGDTLVVGFAAPTDGQGHAVVAANLAALMAEAGCRTLLVDADFQRGWLSRAAQAGGADPQPPVRRGMPGEPDFLPLPAPEGSHATAETPRQRAGLIQRSAAGYDITLVDLPCLSGFGDARVLTEVLDALVLVADWGKVESEELVETLRAVRQPDAKELAVVLTGAPSQGGAGRRGAA